MQHKACIPPGIEPDPLTRETRERSAEDRKRDANRSCKPTGSSVRSAAHDKTACDTKGTHGALFFSFSLSLLFFRSLSTGFISNARPFGPSQARHWPHLNNETMAHNGPCYWYTATYGWLPADHTHAAAWEEGTTELSLHSTHVPSA
jgi:hypothetical protein